MTITREQARDMAEAHAEAMHGGLPREGCPECEGRDLRDYPPADLAERLSWMGLRVLGPADAPGTKGAVVVMHGLTSPKLHGLDVLTYRLTPSGPDHTIVQQRRTA